MSWLGARAHECDQSHWFAVTEHAAPPQLCPICGSQALSYVGDGEVPIFVLQVEDVWELGREVDEDEDDQTFPFNKLTIDECLELGSDLETPWEAVEILAEDALSARTT